MNDVAGLSLALSVVTALRVFAPAARMLVRRLLGATVRIGAESLAERRAARMTPVTPQHVNENGDSQ
ncbi:hypothetical protein [Streptomyces sp. NPDC001401]|uniref:hypothetical protein n=1 Tax=Streptomyces sp. NPDC001401 TaxID=3364570 RepID=UPI0036C8E1EE